MDDPHKMWQSCGCPTKTPGGWDVMLEGMVVHLPHPPRPTRKSGPPLPPQAVKARARLNEFLRLRAAAPPRVGHVLDQLSDLDACRAALPELEQALGKLKARGGSSSQT